MDPCSSLALRKANWDISLLGAVLVSGIAEVNYHKAGGLKLQKKDPLKVLKSSHKATLPLRALGENPSWPFLTFGGSRCALACAT